MYNMYMSQNTKLKSFVYNKKVYQSGTNFIYNGKCILDKKEIYLSNAVVTYMYHCGQYQYFKDDNNVYVCIWQDFENNIVQIVTEENKAPPVKAKEEFYWTDSMVAKTIWYVIIMLVATVFHARIGIWILATVIWYFSTFKNK